MSVASDATVEATLFDFVMGTRIRFGPGCAATLPETLSDSGWRRVGVVVDRNVCDTAGVARLVAAIESSAEDSVVETCMISEPTYEYLEEVRAGFAGATLDCMVGIGGGSTLDVAKAMAVLVNNLEPALAYRGFDKMTEPTLPVVAVPTTAGTGSEVTPNASFVDAAAKKKLGINGEAVRPRFAFLDPELTLTCPKGASVSAAADSIVHATEAYVAHKSTPLSRMFARESVKEVVAGLPVVVDNLSDIKARTQVMYGAFLAGIALMNSGTGPAAALSYPLGVHFAVPHGVAGAVFLPEVVSYNVERGAVEGYAEIARFAGRSDSAADAEAAGAYAAALRDLWARVGLERDLGAFGVTEADVPLFVTETLELAGALEQNPVPFGVDAIEACVRALLPA